MGWIGRGEGIACMAVASSMRDRPSSGCRPRLELRRMPLAGSARGCRGRSATPRSSVRVLREAGVILRPIRPDKLAAGRRERFVRWGASPALGSRPRAITPPGRDRDHRRARGAHLRRDLHRRSNALARALRRRAGSGSGDGVAIMCRNHRGFVEATLACAKLGARRALPEHRLRRPAAGRGDASARSPKALIYDEEFAEPARRRRRRRCAASSPGARRRAPATPRSSS